METHEHKLCPAVWFSGFFGLGALVHLIRSILKFPLIVGSYEVPLTMSLVLALVFAGISIGLLWVGSRRPRWKEK